MVNKSVTQKTKQNNSLAKHRKDRATEEGHGDALQCSRLENPAHRGAWRAAVDGVARVGHELTPRLLPPRKVWVCVSTRRNKTRLERIDSEVPIPI